jgi:acetyltransferase-like isoleucine patch superfamily enzyme
MTLLISEMAKISPDARIQESVRGTTIRIGAHTVVHAFALIQPVGGMGDVEIGEYCQINPQCVLYSGNGIKLGNDVLLAPGVCVAPTNHSFARRDTPIRLQGFLPSKGGAVMEDDVWVGANSVILDGAFIEKGAIIGAGSIVRERIPAYEIWAGVPARKIGIR